MHKILSGFVRAVEVDKFKDPPRIVSSVDIDGVFGVYIKIDGDLGAGKKMWCIITDEEQTARMIAARDENNWTAEMLAPQKRRKK